MSNFFVELGNLIRDVASYSPNLGSETWDVHIIVNPFAGGLLGKKGQSSFINSLTPSTELRDTLEKSYKRTAVIASVRIHRSEHQGHASVLAVQILESSRNSSHRLFIVSIGGDGTHQEVLTGLMSGDPSLLNKALVFRMPAGTGNDAADAWNRQQAVEALTQGCKESYSGAVEFSSATRDIRYSFNIASVGLDAYVVYLTNKLKSVFPGNFYKLFADIGVLFYGLIHGFHEMDMQIVSPEGAVSHQRRKNGIVALGVSGFRTYGNEKWVLPAEENLCSIRAGSIFHNMRVKSRLFKATHDTVDGTTMHSAAEITVRYPARLLMQVDGEVQWLEPEDFPVRLRVIETGIRILSAKQASKLSPRISHQTTKS